jgi:uroporphyrin-III C-methyltransferase
MRATPRCDAGGHFDGATQHLSRAEICTVWLFMSTAPVLDKAFNRATANGPLIALIDALPATASAVESIHNRARTKASPRETKRADAIRACFIKSVPNDTEAIMNTDISTTGKVTLLSAGPGDLDLLTLRAAKALAAADILLLDDLANPDIVTLAPNAHVIRVGKRGGCKSTPQAFIERLMCRYAKKGLHVVRVKGGDALLFGRAGEEIGALRHANIAVEIVNGVSSGFAAAAGLGISLTHRDHCQGVTFVTAHMQDHSQPDWGALAATGTTLAIYMGMSRIGSIASALLGTLAADTPAAVVQHAGSSMEKRVVSTLAHIASDALAAGLGSPAVILIGGAIGEAAAFASHLDDSQGLAHAA